MSQNNILLKDLIEPLEAAPISYFPETIGWKIWALTILALLVVGVFKRLKHYTKNAYRRRAIKAIQKVGISQGAQSLFLINRILKQAACHGFPNQCVAHLSAYEWLKFLDATVDKPMFNDVLSHQWQQSLFVPPNHFQWQPKHVEELKNRCCIWLKKHR